MHPKSLFDLFYSKYDTVQTQTYQWFETFFSKSQLSIKWRHKYFCYLPYKKKKKGGGNAQKRAVLEGSFTVRPFLAWVFWRVLLYFYLCFVFLYPSLIHDTCNMRHALFKWIFLSIYQLYPEHFRAEYAKLIYAIIMYLSREQL